MKMENGSSPRDARKLEEEGERVWRRRKRGPRFGGTPMLSAEEEPREGGAREEYCGASMIRRRGRMRGKGGAQTYEEGKLHPKKGIMYTSPKEGGEKKKEQLLFLGILT